MDVSKAKKSIKKIREENQGIPDIILIKAGITTVKWLKDLYSKDNSEFIAARVIFQMESNAPKCFECWKIMQEVEQEEKEKEKKYWEKVNDWTCPKCNTKNEGEQFCIDCGLKLRDL